MKRIVSIIMIAVLVVSMSISAFADYTEGTLYYTVSNGSVTITGCFGKDAEVTIPATIAGNPVNTIASGAFLDNQYIQILNLPSSVTSVEAGAVAEGVVINYNMDPTPTDPTPTDPTPTNPTPTDPTPTNPTPTDPTPTNPTPTDPTPTNPTPTNPTPTDPTPTDPTPTEPISTPAHTDGFDETDARLSSFIDVPANAYYYDAVEWAVSNEVTTGTAKKTFSPDATCTRGQIVTFLWRAAGKPVASAQNSFTDVRSADYYYDAVIWAVQNGITDGTSATTFSPNATCTRGQIVTFLWRYLGRKSAGTTAQFKDISEDAYYAPAVAWAVQNGVTSGTGTITFSPDAGCTRAQAVTFLYRAVR